MSSKYQDFENVIFLHLCHKPILLQKVEQDYFRNIFVQKLLILTQEFYKNFNILPFNLDNPELDQIREIVINDYTKYITNKDFSKEDNIDTFLSNAKNIITSRYKSYEQEWLIKIVEKTWLPWESSEKGMRMAIQYRRTQTVNSDNIEEVLKKCNDIIDKYNYNVVDDSESLDFFDEKSHKPTPVENLVDCGMPLMNLWASGSQNGGFKPGTVTLFVGEANIGKSVFLANIAKNIMNKGHNVLLVSLEMEVNEIYKRIGASVFGVTIDEYDELANNQSLLRDRIKKYKKESELDDMFRTDDDGRMLSLGILRAKKFPEATIKDISTFYRDEEKKLGIKYHAIILDYFTELNNSYGTKQTDMYMYHKENMNDMYTDASKYQKAWITAHQLKGSDFGADDLNLASMSESRGLAHRPDNIWGIIQTPSMRISNQYYLKNIKTRTGKHKNFKIELKINWNLMNLSETGTHLEPGETIIG